MCTDMSYTSFDREYFAAIAHEELGTKEWAMNSQGIDVSAQGLHQVCIQS